MQDALDEAAGEDELNRMSGVLDETTSCEDGTNTAGAVLAGGEGKVNTLGLVIDEATSRLCDDAVDTEYSVLE